MKGDKFPRIFATTWTSGVRYGRFTPEETAWVSHRINGLLTSRPAGTQWRRTGCLVPVCSRTRFLHSPRAAQ